MVTGYTGTVALTSSDSQAVLPGPYSFIAADAGVHTFSATLKTAGSQSIAATDTMTTSLTGSDPAITVTAAPVVPSKFLVTAPASVTAGSAFSLTVTAVNASGGTVTGYNGTVSFSSSDGQAVLPASYTFTAADKGVHTFSVTLKTAGAQSVTAKDTTTTSLTGSDGSITVSPAAASKLLVSAPSSVQQGDAFSLTVTVQDAYGNTVTGYTGTVAISSSDSHAVLPANYTFKSSDKGVHIFSVTLKTAGTQSVTAKDTKTSSLTGSDSKITVSGFSVNDGSPQQSMVRSLIYTFASPTKIEPGAFELLRNGERSNVKLVITPQSDGATYVITFSGPGVIGGSVPDGKYTLITLHHKVKVLSGPPMTANDVNTFDRLFGDVNGDGVVNSLDKAYLLQAEANPASPYAADFEYDAKDVIDKTDIVQFDKRYKGPADPPKKAPAKFPGRSIHYHDIARASSSPGRESGKVHVNSVDR